MVREKERGSECAKALVFRSAHTIHRFAGDFKCLTLEQRALSSFILIAGNRTQLIVLEKWEISVENSIELFIVEEYF